jgi:hypothetical protein
VSIQRLGEQRLQPGVIDRPLTGRGSHRFHARLSEQFKTPDSHRHDARGRAAGVSVDARLHQES